MNTTEPASGESATLEFVADIPGEHTFDCSIFCGDDHLNMVGTFNVIPATGGPQVAVPEHDGELAVSRHELLGSVDRVDGIEGGARSGVDRRTDRLAKRQPATSSDSGRPAWLINSIISSAGTSPVSALLKSRK